MVKRNKPAWPDFKAQPRQANENPTAAVRPSAVGYTDKPAWPDFKAQPRQANENPTAAKRPPTVKFSDREGEVDIGTCGYSYREWVDSGFYPAGTKSSEMLARYGRFFSVVELNYTWYQMAREEAIARMVEKAPGHLRFAAKLTRTMTHERVDDWQRELKDYIRGISPLGKRLLAVLIQLPPDFDRTVAHRSYLAALLDGLSSLPVAVEFRHPSWARDSVFAELERRRVSLVTVDCPLLPDLFPPLDVVTHPGLFYIRFHGRNRVGWRSANMQKKFHYDYSTEELHRYADDRIRPMMSKAARGLLFFNNHVGAHAPRNAQKLARILAGK
ncbi:hypothetical protein DGMP_02780 [Desulfomarina profundi]|uniref:DUF72 domain-containing protein n=1 Tax=Desulfomarina profundi TaxID=2772557 RepID=A0A8D5JMZ7_9BACT|nr:DUF72 domain-containing protein [Desulfomarina profundi]BCL59585.1 hypothetical protein DGMP_02780 [Desulfomarina profundi]